MAKPLLKDCCLAFIKKFIVVQNSANMIIFAVLSLYVNAFANKAESLLNLEVNNDVAGV